MRTINIVRAAERPPLAGIFRKDLLQADPTSKTSFVIHFKNMREPPVKDLDAIARLKDGTAIANVQHPLGYLNKMRVPFIQITKNEGNLFSMVCISTKLLPEDYPRKHSIAFFSHGKKDFFIAVPDEVSISYSNMAAGIAARFPALAKSDKKNFGLEFRGGGSRYFFVHGRISQSADIFKDEIHGEASRAVNHILVPVLPQLAEFSKLLGAGWIAEKIEELC